MCQAAPPQQAASTVEDMERAAQRSEQSSTVQAAYI